MKRVVAVALGLLLLLSACAYSPTVEAIRRCGVMVMVTSADFPPFEYEEDGVLTGIDLALGAVIAKKLKVSLRVEDMDFEDVLASISAGTSDIALAAISANVERAKTMDFSEPYYNTQIRLVAPAGTTKLSGLHSLEGLSVGVQTGTVADKTLSEAGGIGVVRFANDEEAVNALLAGQLDAVAADETAAAFYTSESEGSLVVTGEPLTEGESYVVAVRKGSGDLVEYINKLLRDMQENGELDALLGRYR